MASGSSRTLAGRARSVVGRALGSRSARSSDASETVSQPATKAAKKTVEKSAAKKTAAKKTAAKKPASKKATVKKPAAKKSATKQTAAKRSTAKKTATSKAATKSTTHKTPATPPARTSTTSSTEKTTATKKASAAPTKTPSDDAKTTTGTTTATSRPRARKGSPGALVVLPSEEPWTKAELDKVKAHLRDDVRRLVPELDVADNELHELMVDAGDGAGADQADVGSSSFERDQGLTIANNARDMLVQSQHALERIEDGSYGVCESCGEPIGKKRLMAFPRATLCMTCKQREERH